MSRPPKINNSATREMNKAQEKFDQFEESVKSLTLDQMNKAPKEESEPQTKLSSQDFKKSTDIYLKPKRVFPPSPHPKTGKVEQFNEKFREAYEHDKEYVHFIAENIEIQGESINLWTKPYPGVAAEEWSVPVNKPVWGPRYLAEKIKRCCYHRLSMDNTTTTAMDGMGTYFGGMVVDSIKHRLDAHAAPKTQVSFFKKASSF